jgi:hypothetical protein
MKNNFTKHFITIDLARVNGTDINMGISSDFSGSERKSRLYVNEKRIAEQVERFWKSIKTKKLVILSVSFGECDYYDNIVDVYETPVVSIRRGLKKARIGSKSHGCIPKEWSFDLTCRFKDTSTSTPILEVVKAALGSFFTEKHEKELKKALKPFLQKKVMYANWEIEDEDY